MDSYIFTIDDLQTLISQRYTLKCDFTARFIYELRYSLLLDSLILAEIQLQLLYDFCFIDSIFIFRSVLCYHWFYISCFEWSQRQVSLSLMVCMISDLLIYLLISSTYFLKLSTYTFISDRASVDTTEDVEEFSMPLALVLTNYFCPPFMLCCTISFLLIVQICWLNYSFIFRRFSSSSLLKFVSSSLITRSSLEILINSRFRISCNWWSMISPNISVISSTIFCPSTGRLPSMIDQGYFPAFSKAKVGSSCFYQEVRWTPQTHRWTYAKNFQFFVSWSIRLFISILDIFIQQV